MCVSSTTENFGALEASSNRIGLHVAPVERSSQLRKADTRVCTADPRVIEFTVRDVPRAVSLQRSAGSEFSYYLEFERPRKAQRGTWKVASRCLFGLRFPPAAGARVRGRRQNGPCLKRSTDCRQKSQVLKWGVWFGLRVSGQSSGGGGGLQSRGWPVAGPWQGPSAVVLSGS